MKISKTMVFKTYLFSFFLTLMIVIVFLFLTRGQFINCYFFADELDTGMDFFNSLTYVSTKKPYIDYETLYSPFANFIYLLLYRFTCAKVEYPESFYLGISNRGTTGDLRLFQATSLVYLIYTIVISILIFILIVEFFDKEKNVMKYLIASSLLLSYGSLYAFERGNIIILSLFTALFFLFYYASDNKFLSEIALISLAFSFGLKLYPAVFGLILIIDKKYAAAVRCCIYAILTIILPCFVFEEGFGCIFLWIKQVISFSGRNAAFTGNSLSQLLYFADDLIGMNLNFSIVNAFSGLMLVLIFIAIFISRDKVKTIALLSALMVMASPQANYIYCFYYIPVLFIFRFKKTISISDFFILIFLFNLTACLPIFDAELFAFHHLVFSVALIWLLIIDSFYQLFVYLKNKKTRQICIYQKE